MRALVLLGAAVFIGTAAWILAEVDKSDDVEVVDRQGLVTRVVDGDTLRARIGGSNERVRLIGVDAPERGECYFERSSELLRELALDRVVRIVGDSTQRERDRFGRLLAYVLLRNGKDAGSVLLEHGAAVVFETGPRFARHEAYVQAQARAAREPTGLHRACR